MVALPAQRSRSWAARAAADIQDTIAGRKLKIISRESAEALPHLTYQVFPSGSMLTARTGVGSRAFCRHGGTVGRT
jgi:hypothetical protein